MSLKNIDGKTNGLAVSGGLVYNLTTSLADGKLDVNASNLSGLSPFLNSRIGGIGKVAVVANAKNKKQFVDARGNFSNLDLSGMKIGILNFAVKTADIQKLDGLQGNVDIAKLQSGENVIDKISLTASGKKQLLDFKLNVQTQKPPSVLDSSGRFNAELPNWKLVLNKLSGNYGNNRFALIEPVKINKKNDVVNIESLMLNLNGAAIAAGGRYSPAKVDIKLTANNAPLKNFTDNEFGGVASLATNITGSAAAPVIKSTIRIDKLMTQDTASLPLAINGNVDYSNRKIAARLDAGQGDGKLSANALIPAVISLEPFVFDLPKTGQLSGAAVVDMDLVQPAPLFLPVDQILQGHVKGNLALAGTLGKPEVKGNVNLDKARYENLSTGTLLQNINAEIVTDGKTARLVNMQADAGKGKINVNGSLQLAEPNAINFAAKLKNAAIVQRKEISGVINGDITANGNIKSPLVAGSLIIGPMDINIPESSGVNVETVEIRNPQTLPKQSWQKVEQAAKAEEPSIIKLDIKVSAPAKVFVRGRGLETEMRGDLHITGTAGSPAINGELRTLRGVFRLLDKDLALKQGILTFRGPIPPSPYLNIQAETVTNDITAGISLTGSVNEPVLKLTSDPALPEDEVLSHILFGNELKSITPIQGIQLVQALNTLRGGGGPGFDPVGKIRKAIKVDRLNVDTNEAGDVTVGAGKYVTDKIYLGVEGGAGEDSGRVKAEIEAAKNITIETESGANSNGVSVNWKYDY